MDDKRSHGWWLRSVRERDAVTEQGGERSQDVRVKEAVREFLGSGSTRIESEGS